MMSKKLSKELKQVIEDLEWHVSKRKGCKSVTLGHTFFSQKLEQLIEIHNKIAKQS